MEGTINYMEIWVKEHMEELLKESDMCKCEKCKRDVYAFALNHLKPFYVATNRGRLITKASGMHQQLETDIIIEITKAINIVSNNARHDD